MYRKILVALENSRTDEAILAHIEPLARLMGSELVLVHVADGWVARKEGRAPARAPRSRAPPRCTRTSRTRASPTSRSVVKRAAAR